MRIKILNFLLPTYISCKTLLFCISILLETKESIHQNNYRGCLLQTDLRKYQYIFVRHTVGTIVIRSRKLY